MTVTKVRDRAARLRKEADSLPEPVAVAYRRRAAELELTALALHPFEEVALAA